MIDKVTAERDVSWLGARLREKSTYAGIAVLLGLSGLGANASPVANDISLIGMGVGGLLAVLMPEKGGVKAIAFLIAASAAFTLYGPPARAQTVPLPAKAPAAAAAVADPCTQASCTTWYFGGNLVNDGGNFDVLGSGLSGLASNGIMFGGDFGAQFWNGQWFAALEGDAEYALTMNAPSDTGLGTSNSYALGAQVKLGYSLAGLFGASTSGASAPTLPSALQNALVSPYVAIGVWDRPWGAGLATGAGAQALIAQDWTLDAEYLHVNYDNAAVNPDVSEQTENLFLIGLNRHFAF